MPAPIAVVLSGWPRVSETFALNELVALRRSGMLGAVFATKAGDTSLCQPGWREVDELVEVLPATDAAGQADVIARRLTDVPIAGVHGYFAHQPAEVAALAARQLGVPYGFSAHALDVRKVPPAALAERAAGAAIVVSCNDDTTAALQAVGADPCVVRHGVDLRRFAPTPPPGGPTLELLAVGRLVEKKGFDVLLDAVALADRPVRLRIVGDGPERERLVRITARLGLDGTVQFLGRRTHEELPALYRSADVVVVPSVVDQAGDRDGLPNVVLEAMASGRPVVASDVGATTAAVLHCETGVIVAAGDAHGLATALVALYDEPEVRLRLGRTGASYARRWFDLERRSADLCETLRKAYG